MTGTLQTPQINTANSSEEPKIPTAISTLNGLLTSSNLIDPAQFPAASVTDSKLASPNNSAYRTLLSAGVSLGGTTVGTWGLGIAGQLIATGASTVGNVVYLMPFVAADVTVGSLTQKLRIRQQVVVGSTSPSTVTLNCGLYPVTISAGNYTLGPVVPNSATSTTGLATNTISSFTSASGDFTIPADGAYCLGIVVGSITVPSGIDMIAHLQTRNV